ncbi:putative tRNA pseudouridine synthase Pus10 [Choristoneura fumiferana]|uniref:putative tRNA pseudouridine synthase Pus10 n=1 Tax=Choristoneura fumiferana TaxID=7141 RepID=UPI003D159962
MCHVTKEDLAELKKGEETKSKDYEALCIKLDHSEFDEVSDPMAPVAVTAADIARINAFRNTPADDPAAAAVRLVQRTPIRVLHRRPLLARDKHILSMRAEPVPGHPALLVLRLRAGAGAYVKEFVHGELGRTRPALGAALGAGPTCWRWT